MLPASCLIELPVFKGNPLKWQGSWDQFEISVHQNESISDIDCFNCLKKYLSDLAVENISGLTLNSANYKESVTILTVWYDNRQVVISAHLVSVLKMKVKKANNMENLNGLIKSSLIWKQSKLKHPVMAVFLSLFWRRN